jgi:acetyltransferase-like isoleucine patch superfamily enzyme
MNGVHLYQFMRDRRDAIFSHAVSRSFMEFGPRSIIQMPIVIHGERRISIGRDVFIGSSSWLHVSGPEARLEIGDGTRMSGHCVLSAMEHVRLGRSVLLGRNVYIADSSHRTVAAGVPIMDQGYDNISPVIIEDNAWLGQHCVILPGVSVGRGSVVGANSVVRDDVPPRTVVAGAPARVVRHLD